MTPCFGGGEFASPVPFGSSSSQVPADETALRAASVSTATDDATASSSSTPSTEGLQDHIESLLQHLPDEISLNQKSSPNSMVGVPKPVSLHRGPLVPANAFAYTPAGYKTWNSGRPCQSWQNGQFYNLCKFVLAALSACAHHPLGAARAGLGTILDHCTTPPAATATAGWINDVR